MKRIGLEDLVEKTAVTAVVSKEQARKVIKAFVAELKLALCKGEGVALKEFGTFRTVHRAQKKGHNPATGESITIPEKDTVTFRISRKFKDMLND
uniref:HU family DNA-binding protein n=1 Tax=uncultured Allisonella sp. TaxID=339338 RepID=UPI00266F6FAE|nr:HU family DNA-binding protein [uncultured Allisonella sp.]